MNVYAIRAGCKNYSVRNSKKCIQKHTNDKIYYIRNGERFTCNSLSKFCANLHSDDVIHLLGAPEHVDFIINIADTIRDPSRIRLCSLDFKSSNVWKTLNGMQNCILPSSVGGFYSLANTTVENIYRSAYLYLSGDVDKAIDLFKSSKLYMLLDFACYKCDAKLTELVITILDPRRFVDPENPDKLSKLFSSCGLTPNRQKRIMRGTIKDDKDFMCKLIFDCWYDEKYHMNAFDNYITYNVKLVEDSILEGLAPGDFLYRYLAHFLGFGIESLKTPKPAHVAFSMVSKIFIKWLFFLWLHTIYFGQYDIFDGNMIFKNYNIEVAAFSSHCKFVFSGSC